MKQKSYTKVCQEKPKTMCDDAYRSKKTKTCYYRFFLHIIIIIIHTDIYYTLIDLLVYLLQTQLYYYIRRSNVLMVFFFCN